MSVAYLVIDWGSAFGRGAGVFCSIDITLDITSSFIVIVGEITSVIQNWQSTFGSSIDRGSFASRSAAVFSCGGRSTHTK